MYGLSSVSSGWAELVQQENAVWADAIDILIENGWFCVKNKCPPHGVGGQTLQALLWLQI